MKKKILVIGSHVSESLSPLIFNYWFKKYNINATYSFKEINPPNFEKEIKEILEDEELLGFNVTIPFKEVIKDRVFSLETHAQKIGAINCVSNINQKWIGKNTDWIGFYKSIEDKIDKSKLNRAHVLGYGGASKAILYALKKIGFKEIVVYNRTVEKIKHLKEEKHIFVIDYKGIYQEIESFDVVINTTPTNVLKEPLNNKKQKVFGFDIVYKPKETDFLRHFSKEKQIYGISMLINQAVPCFEDWFGVRPLADSRLYSLLEKKITK